MTSPRRLWAEIGIVLGLSLGASAVYSIVAIVNPDSGPGGGPPNDDYAHGLADLRAGGVGLLGYVATGYGARSAAAVKASVP